MTKRIIKVFQTPRELAESCASEIADRITQSGDKNSVFSIALSGGSTPKILFGILADQYNEKINWNLVQLFWVDERCVPPVDPESNYGMTRTILLDKIAIPLKNVHRIRGEDNPFEEAKRYSNEIRGSVKIKNSLPAFDLMILGVGDDGHTASVFPYNHELLTSDKICDVSAHPVSNQNRITITGKVINNSDSVFLLVTGQNKAPVIEAIVHEKAEAAKFPASYIDPAAGPGIWMLDKAAAELIKSDL